MTAEPQGAATEPTAKTREELETVTILFSGDSGDGMQLTGTEFTRASAIAGNDLQTFPDYPAEIRAPAGTIAGVSGFQLQFSSGTVYTSGDQPDVLVAMNPAALKAKLHEVVRGGILLINSGAFTAGNLEKAGYKTNPLEDGALAGYRVLAVDMSKLTAVALQGLGLGAKEVARAKNMFALGLLLWMYSRPMEPTLRFFEAKFGGKPLLRDANERALKAGMAYGDASELFAVKYDVKPAKLAKGTYRNVSGNEATAYGIITAAKLSGLRVFLGSYPITPATEILQELSKHRNHGVTTVQFEDEIAGVCSAIGASFGGALAVTTTSGPGLCLKAEAINLAVMAELPLLIVNVQRGGPSTGLPTKSEQADLLQSIFGRNGESPLPVVAAASPSDCYDATIAAIRIALKHLTPVILLTDGYIGQGQEPWLLPDIAKLEPFPVKFRTDPEGYQPFLRNPDTLAREWVRPGTKGLEHRLGGLERNFLTGAVTTDPGNHEKMSYVRAEKVARCTRDYPKLEVKGDPSGGTLVVTWGSTYGAAAQAVGMLRAKGKKVSHLQLRHVWPLPTDLKSTLARYDRVLVPEINLGQMLSLIRAETLIDAKGIHFMQGRPFNASRLASKIEELSS